MSSPETEYIRSEYYCVCGHVNLDHLIEHDGLWHCISCLCTKLEPCEE